MTAFADNFWREYTRFLKTPLITELPNPKTAVLSTLAEQDSAGALQLLFDLDLEMINNFKQQCLDITPLTEMLTKVLGQGGRVFLVGCGASGRMAAQIEYLWRDQQPQSTQVQAVIAGGDIALIEAVEACEDQPLLAERHLKELKLNSTDIVLGLSAGGESPFILAAMNYAANICLQAPCLIHCNPKASLIERNPQHVLATTNCKSLYLNSGPMALTGSTRMQATTLMTLALLQAFFNIAPELDTLIEILRQLPYAELAKFAQFERSLLQKQDYVLYHSSAQYALSVLADTTERAPTFNLPKFEPASLDKVAQPALAYVVLTATETSAEAWLNLLHRPVQSLAWSELPQTAASYVQQFDLSAAYTHVRRKKLQPHTLVDIDIIEDHNALQLSWSDSRVRISVGGLSLALKQLLLRLIMVNHSSTVFGALGFYQGNLMTYLRPSNFKLVDRAVRYAQFLAHEHYGKALSYQEVAACVLQLRENLAAQHSIVAEALTYLIKTDAPTKKKTP